ncbi:Peptidyl-prolyl cis-trans isomerase (EC 5.2.1.8) [uncultured Gammaproteobacteria bacterium]|jgi:peptidylprolyl isomerase|nr:Peptidyl-prolyl cis-trans isomerase (EC 5.2.1.8) [uncultured Gammaproteobacteria bacterium]CAC9558124.1 Peptidyl-prolyl cis-trans isomerase (EC 5.2.1.8) [uncultured Gammaproteobacteria bacterium]CAC9562810.1 Peptidyl-prolyl cis-trans isomerase (EC 5.2.1.8) [uncultured Gammaproteobacteria bacterium]CAC9566903.1 Peptidyl-prolyl cis-trans isomerase (EC 5.2.1.8) [uncultured Gammaproteobacteria bacterium]CAC9574214.1 Peptidyl-prolyl cis-trans isomerase (EC 5.2.1.8) [uncultured Gammaproteobacteria
MRILIAFFTLFLSIQSQAKLADGLYANLHTNQGDIIVQLAYKKAPLTVINFVGLAEGTKRSNVKIGKPFYNGLKFHRVIDNFMIQGGDPKGNGTGGPGYQFADEFSDLKHDSGGILSMANSGPGTNGSQFFITHTATPHLNDKHTVFGRVVKGMEVVNSIKQEDFIRKLNIIRIGDEAKKFQTDEAAFQAQSKKYLVKNNEKLTKFVKKNYPNAKARNSRHFIQVNQAGTGAKSNTGNVVKVNISFRISNKEIKEVKEIKEIITFTLGDGTIHNDIEQSILGMKVGEKRTVIMRDDINIMPKGSFVIVNLELISISK